MAKPEEVRDRIVEAAQGLFQHYGYCKTTMSDLARDCSMSPGNLYRYFKGKEDIAEAMGMRCFETIWDRLRVVSRSRDIDAEECLRRFLMAELESTYELFEKQPQFLDMMQLLMEKRAELGNRYLATSRSMLAEILARGNSQSQFHVDDVVRTAEMIQAATTKFRFPQLSSRLDLPQLRDEAAGVISLLLNGLSPTAERTGA